MSVLFSNGEKHNLVTEIRMFNDCEIGDLVMFYSGGKLKIGIKLDAKEHNGMNFQHVNLNEKRYTGRFHSVYRIINTEQKIYDE